MEDILKYISIISLSGTGIAFIIGLIKWIDNRNLEQEQKQCEGFHKMICLVSGVNESGKTVKLAQQIAAIYQLQRFKKYSYAIIPSLEILLRQSNHLEKNEDTKSLIIAFEKTINVLEANN